MEINQQNLHHAYLIVGSKEVCLPKTIEIVKSLGVSTVSNPDFFQIETDTFKVEDARNLVNLTSEKTFAEGENAKKVFIVAANQFLLEAQNTLLKILEEPAQNTHFFILSPSRHIFVSTLISRFFVIDEIPSLRLDVADSNFLKMNLIQRIDFIKSILSEVKEENEDNENDSPRTAALKLLNEIEISLYRKYINNTFRDVKIFEHIFEVRHNLRQPGSAPKMLLESVALAVPEKM